MAAYLMFRQDNRCKHCDSRDHDNDCERGHEDSDEAVILFREGLQVKSSLNADVNNHENLELGPR